jgi:hypothetical protein
MTHNPQRILKKVFNLKNKWRERFGDSNKWRERFGDSRMLLAIDLVVWEWYGYSYV